MKSFLQYLKEYEIYDEMTTNDGRFRIFKNPTQVEVRKAIKDSKGYGVRGVYVYSTKNLYIWSSEVIHADFFDLSDKIDELRNEDIDMIDFKKIWNLAPIKSFDFDFSMLSQTLDSDSFFHKLSNVKKKPIEKREAYIDKYINPTILAPIAKLFGERCIIQLNVLVRRDWGVPYEHIEIPKRSDAEQKPLSLAQQYH